MISVLHNVQFNHWKFFSHKSRTKLEHVNWIKAIRHNIYTKLQVRPVNKSSSEPLYWINFTVMLIPN